MDYNDLDLIDSEEDTENEYHVIELTEGEAAKLRKKKGKSFKEKILS